MLYNYPKTIILMNRKKHFTIINAGMPKTASKSCSAAMEMLGYKVADIVETATLLLDVWLDYYDGNATIEGKANSPSVFWL